MIQLKIDKSGIEKKLKEMEKGAQKVQGENNVPFKELFNPSFMRKNTQHNSIDEMLDNSGFKIENSKDFEAVDDSEWDEYVRKTTRFENWDEMMSDASKLWVLKQIGL
ncbi:hypothetical protein FGU46_03200 [Methanobacterium sp. CWC-01]|uniref:hypothetical protein n=1 Tax=Methanobacterium aridiramus TaxID=2584467 RepID=UPI00257554EF|nr:hypothetical protein [Methanobacterium sp. CWC-01]WJI09166.1 hypothetical protein FGU46_03200 [Methanobacterium sp. CWC-01]